MGLTVPPTPQRAIPRQVPLFTMPWAGAITYKGKFYGIGYPVTAIDTMAYFNVWDDPTHLETYRNLPLVNNGKIFGSTLDVANQAIYVGPYFTGSPRTARVWKWDLVTEQLTVLVNDVALGIGSPQTGTQSGITNDGTYLYFVYYTQVGTGSWVFKFRISDGTLVSKIQVTGALPVTGNIPSGASHIEMLDASNLIVAGIVPGWVASIPTDLSVVTNAVETRNDGGGMFGLQVIPGGLGAWVGDYTEAKFYVFTDPALGSWTTYDYSAQAGPNNGCFDLRFDGYEWVWAAMRDYTILGIDTGSNPASDDPGVCEHVLRELTTLPPGATGSGGWKPGMIWPLNEKEPLLSSPGPGIAMADSLAAATQFSYGYFVQYGTARSQPRLLGRGSSGRR